VLRPSAARPQSLTLPKWHGQHYFLFLRFHMTCCYVTIILHVWRDAFQLLCPQYSVRSDSSKYYAHVTLNLLYLTCSNTTNMANNYEGAPRIFCRNGSHGQRSIRASWIHFYWQKWWSLDCGITNSDFLFTLE